MIKDIAIKEFLVDLASQSATPGGGSVAAINGAMAAALVSMVCNLTIGRIKYRHVEDEMKSVFSKSEDLRRELTETIQDDVRAFDAVMGAYGMPKETEAQKAARNAEIQAALKQATDVPLHCCKAAREVMDLATIATEKGNLNAVGDAGVALFAAYAALRSGALNVYTNAKLITDKTFTEARLKELEKLLSGTEGAMGSRTSVLMPIKLRPV